jgi:PAS domain-containing protein
MDVHAEESFTRRQIIELGCNPAQWPCLGDADESGQPVQVPFQTMLATGQPLRDLRTMIDLPDGRRVWLAINAALLFDSAGHVDKVVVTIGDVTEQVTAQRALEERTYLYNSLVERVPALEAGNGPDAMCLWAQRGLSAANKMTTTCDSVATLHVPVARRRLPASSGKCAPRIELDAVAGRVVQ